MNPHSSSTSSSDAPSADVAVHRAPTLRGCGIVVFWTIVFLALGDVAINIVFAMPADRTQEPGALQQFFNYGRSIEGKLRQMMGPDDATTHPLLLPGWIDDNLRVQGMEGWSREPRPLRVVSYGQSFVNHICMAMEETEQGGEIALRLLAAPAAPLSHSHALYMRDRGGRDADIVVLGVLASSLPALHSTAHMTWNFEAPAGYTYPRYRLDRGHLVHSDLPLETLGDLRAALNDPSRWHALREHIRANDEFFSATLFDRTALDRSTIARCLRRALAQRHDRAEIAKVHDARGFRLDSGIVDLAQALVLDFARAVRSDGAVPIIVLMHDQGFSDHLFRALSPILEDAGVSHISTHDLAPATDPANFVADGHFTPERESAIAKRLLETIRVETANARGQ